MMDSNGTGLHTMTVLYVNDNEKARRLLGRVLKDCGFTVVCAVDPSEAIRQARQLPVDLALIEYRLPEMSGAELAQKLKGLSPNLPIIMISGFAALPDNELVFVDAHFGRCSALDDLLATMRDLVLPNSRGQQDRLLLADGRTRHRPGPTRGLVRNRPAMESRRSRPGE